MSESGNDASPSDRPRESASDLPVVSYRRLNRGRPWQLTIIGWALLTMGYVGVLWKPCVVAVYFVDLTWLTGPYDRPQLPVGGVPWFVGFQTFSWVVSIIAVVAGAGVLKLRLWSKKWALAYAVLALLGTGIDVGHDLLTIQQQIPAIRASNSETIDLTNQQMSTQIILKSTLSGLGRVLFPLLVIGLVRGEEATRAFSRARLLPSSAGPPSAFSPPR